MLRCACGLVCTMGRTCAGRDLVLWENALLGSIAGGAAAAVTTPLDVAKTRLMVQGSTPAADRYTGVRDVLVRVAREEGVATLFSGIVPRVAWISVGGAIFIGSFEEFRRRLTVGTGAVAGSTTAAAQSGTGTSDSNTR